MPSVMVIGTVFGPCGIAAPTVASNVNVCSPVVAFAPASVNGWLAEPPIDERSPVTVRLVLVGVVPGLAMTVNVTSPPCETTFGLADPVPLGNEHPGID